MPSAMRTGDRRISVHRTRIATVAVAIGLLAGACGGGAPSGPPASATPVATAAPTPVAHLVEPVKADAIYQAMIAAGLRLAANNASTGGPGHEPVKRINATYAGWPLAISQFTTAASLLDSTNWKAGGKPRTGEPPISFLGLNILVEWGPTTGSTPNEPDDRQLAAAAALHAALDPLVSPLAARTIVPIPGVAAAVTPAPSPEPSAAPNRKPSPKPTKKP